ncbi:MAG TPA: hypothetical protein VD794_04165 [Flavisolibacter sp.]|nr:hypothetical protein [Flavisolibacter sp.]
MDSRATLNVKATFIELMKEAKLSGSKVHLIIDDGGLSREEGFIKSISADNEYAIIELDKGLTIALQKVVAVNGIFLPDYAEC